MAPPSRVSVSVESFVVSHLIDKTEVGTRGGLSKSTEGYWSSLRFHPLFQIISPKEELERFLCVGKGNLALAFLVSG